MIHEPTELQSQADALGLLLALAENAGAAGLTVAPTWTVCGSLVTGTLHSADASALTALQEWRQLLGTHALGSYTTDGVGGPRRVWTATAVLGEVQVAIMASVPAAVRAIVGTAGIEVAA